MQRVVDSMTPEQLMSHSEQELQQTGISYRKVGYIRAAAQKIIQGQLRLDTLTSMDDRQVCRLLTQLDGVGEWTAEMLMIFSMQRMDVLSFHDLGIIRGLKRLYGLSEVDRATFETYRARYSPYGSVASLYLWALAGERDPSTER